MDLSKCLRSSAGGTELDIIVTPNSSNPGVHNVDPWRHRLVVKVRAPPEGGRANEEVEELLTSVTGAKATVIRGHTQRMKVVHLAVSKEDAERALEGVE